MIRRRPVAQHLYLGKPFRDRVEGSGAGVFGDDLEHPLAEVMLENLVPERDPPGCVGRVTLMHKGEVGVGAIREEADGQPPRCFRLIEIFSLLKGGTDRLRVGPIQVFRISEHLVRGFSGLADDRACVERLSEDRLRVAPQLGSGLLAGPERGRGADADEVLFRRREPVFHPPQEEGEVRPLGPVEGVHLVDHEEPQGLRVVLLPQRLVASAQEEVVEHLVVREKDVRRVAPHRLAMGDDAVRSHLVGCVLRFCVRVDPRADPMQGRNRAKGRRDPARLVGGQRVHRINQDRLDPRRPLVLSAML